MKNSIPSASEIFFRFQGGIRISLAYEVDVLGAVVCGESSSFIAILKRYEKDNLISI